MASPVTAAASGRVKCRWPCLNWVSTRAIAFFCVVSTTALHIPPRGVPLSAALAGCIFALIALNYKEDIMPCVQR